MISAGRTLSSTQVRRRWRRVLRALALSGAVGGVAVVTTPAVAGGAVVVLGVMWGLWRWPRWEDRLFGSPAPVERYQQSRVPPHGRPINNLGRLAPEAHRAFARALHAVTAAYLAECEREAER